MKFFSQKSFSHQSSAPLLPLLGLTLPLLILSACSSEHHEKIHAVDAVALAEKNAAANAPAAEAIKFDDEDLPKAGTGTDQAVEGANQTAKSSDPDTETIDTATEKESTEKETSQSSS